MMTMVTPIVRRAGEGEDPVVPGVVAVDIVIRQDLGRSAGKRAGH